MKTFVSHIVRESEVWTAEDPDHMIHFNGERFLGPYPDVMQKNDYQTPPISHPRTLRDTLLPKLQSGVVGLSRIGAVCPSIQKVEGYRPA